MFDVCVAGFGLYVSHVTAEEGEHSEQRADAQSPKTQRSPELFYAELLGLRLKLTGVVGGVVVPEALGYDHASCPIDQCEGVVATWAHDDQRC